MFRESTLPVYDHGTKVRVDFLKPEILTCHFAIEFLRNRIWLDSELVHALNIFITSSFRFASNSASPFSYSLFSLSLLILFSSIDSFPSGGPYTYNIFIMRHGRHFLDSLNLSRPLLFIVTPVTDIYVIMPVHAACSQLVAEKLR